MTTATNRPGTSVAEVRGAFAPQHRDVRAEQRREGRPEAGPHEDVVEFLLERYRDVMIELAER